MNDTATVYVCKMYFFCIWLLNRIFFSRLLLQVKQKISTKIRKSACFSMFQWKQVVDKHDLNLLVKIVKIMKGVHCAEFILSLTGNIT